MSLNNRRKLNDEDKMPFGKHAGKPLKEVPDHYWRWFVKQVWAKSYPDLLEYGQIVEEDD